MSKKGDIMHLWREAYKDSPEYLDMYFARIYRDADALTVEEDGKAVSSLLLQPYGLWFYGREMPVSYIAGVTTRRQARGRGYASSLLREALRLSRERGDMMCALIPAHGWLYYFFERFGFSPVFLADVQRFTSQHKFAGEGEYDEVSDLYSDAVYEAFAALERRRPGGILHTRRDFMNFLDDLTMRPEGTFTVVSSGERGVVAMAWASLSDDVVQVYEVLGYESADRLAAMRQLRSRFPGKPMRYLAPSDTPGHRRLYPRGMARIVNVPMCLAAVAEANSQWSCRIRVTDPLIEENNVSLAIARGRCEETADTAPDGFDFDVNIDVLNRIVFSSESTGSVLGFPSRRTHISLMPH